ncbi:MAG: tetratricopeptide repeat protein [Flavobacteriaceae bacterium]
MKHKLTLLVLFIAPMIFSQSFNKEIRIDSIPNLIGKFTKEALLKEPYAAWFEKNYNEYEPDAEVISLLENELSKYTITLFMGTWCGDSKIEVSRFYKIMEAVNFPLDRITAIAVSNQRETYKQSIGGEQEGFNIHRVPTFILYKNGKEVNRIIEHPITTLEEDLWNSIQDNYTPNYDGVTYINSLLEKMGVEKFRKKQLAIARKVQNKITKFSELNTYSSVLFYAKRTEEGIAIAELNTQLYPSEVSGYINLGNKYSYLQNKEKAMHYYKKALSLDPKNNMAKKGIELLL